MKFNTYKAVFKAYIHPDNIKDFTFQEIVDELRKHEVLLNEKEDGCLFNVNSFISDFEHPGKFGKKDPTYKIDYSPFIRTELIRRCKPNVDMIYCLLLDVDSNMTIVEALAQWVGYEFFMYTTHSHSKAKDKFRIVIPLKTPMTLLEFDSRHESMCTRFKIVDKASFTISQCFYYPSHNKDNKDDAFTYHNKVDDRFDALELPPKMVAPMSLIQQTYIAPTSISAYGLTIYQRLLRANNLHVPDGMPLAVLCKTHGIDFDGFKAIVMQAGQGSQISNKATDLKDLYTKAYANGMRRETQEKLMQQIGC